MKISDTKPLYTLLTLLFIGFSAAKAQDTTKRHWLVPSSVVIQHAGSIGYFSVSAGYYLNKSHNMSLDLGYGYVPAKFGGDLNIVSGKFIWRPFSFDVKDWGSIRPFNPGFMLSYHAGSDFDSSWDDDEYPEGYYWWSTAIRPHILFGTEIVLNAKKIFPKTKLKSLTLYSEFNTNELYAVSYFQNRHDLTLRKIFKLGLGARIAF